MRAASVMFRYGSAGSNRSATATGTWTVLPRSGARQDGSASRHTSCRSGRSGLRGTRPLRAVRARLDLGEVFLVGVPADTAKLVRERGVPCGATIHDLHARGVSKGNAHPVAWGVSLQMKWTACQWMMPPSRTWSHSGRGRSGCHSRSSPRAGRRHPAVSSRTTSPTPFRHAVPAVRRRFESLAKIDPKVHVRRSRAGDQGPPPKRQHHAARDRHLAARQEHGRPPLPWS